MNKENIKDSICFSQHWIVDLLNSNQERAMNKIINTELPNALGDIVPNYTIMLNVGGEDIEDKFLAAQTFLDWARDPSFIDNHHRIVFDFAYSTKMDIPKIKAIEDRDQQNNTIKIDYEKLVQQKFNTDLTLDQIESIYVKAFELEDAKLKNEYGITNTEFISFPDLVHKYLSDEEIAQQPYINTILEKRVLNMSAYLDGTRLIASALHLADEENIVSKDFDLTKHSAHKNIEDSFVLPDNVNLMIGDYVEFGQLNQVRNGQSDVFNKSLDILNKSCILSLDKNDDKIPYDSWEKFKKLDFVHSHNIKKMTDRLCCQHYGKDDYTEEELDNFLANYLIPKFPEEITWVNRITMNEIYKADESDYIISAFDIKLGRSWKENEISFIPDISTQTLKSNIATHQKIALNKDYYDVDYANAPLWLQDQDLSIIELLTRIDYI